MKKFLILTGIAALAVASCAKDEVKEVNKGHAIDFNIAQTKGHVMEYNSDIEHFYVTALEMNQEDNDITLSPYFTDAAFARLGDYFTSNPAYYWPADGTNLLFMAYTPGVEAMGSATVEITPEKAEIIGFAPAEDINDQIDLMTAVTIGNKENETSGVALTFKHRLSRIDIRALENNSEYSFSVKGVRLVNMASEGTLTIGAETDEWDLDQDKATYTLEYDTPVSLRSSYETLMYKADNNANENDALVLPQTLVAWDPSADEENVQEGVYIGVKLQVKSAVSGDQIFPAAQGEYGWVAVPVPDGLALEAGMQYYFYLNFTNGAGYIDPELGGLVGGNPGEKVLGDDIMFNVKVNPIEEPTAGAAIRKDLEGEWLAKKVDVHYEYVEGYAGPNYTDFTREDPAVVEEWFQNNGFYKFSVDNDYNITMKTPSGVVATSSFTVDDDGYIYLEAYKTADGYTLVPKVHEIDSDNNICIIELIEEDYSGNEGMTRIQHLYYDRN